MSPERAAREQATEHQEFLLSAPRASSRGREDGLRALLDLEAVDEPAFRGNGQAAALTTTGRRTFDVTT